MKKKIVSMLLVVLLMLSITDDIPTRVYAAANSKEDIIVYYLTDDISLAQDNSESKIVYESFRGDRAPVYFFDLSSATYNYSFSDIINYTFTLYYFKPSATGWLTLSMNNWDSGVEDVRIEVYLKKSIGSDELVHVWTGNPELYSGIGFPNLDSEKNYYFKFMAYHADSISGTGSIYQ